MISRDDFDLTVKILNYSYWNQKTKIQNHSRIFHSKIMNMTHWIQYFWSKCHIFILFWIQGSKIHSRLMVFVFHISIRNTNQNTFLTKQIKIFLGYSFQKWQFECNFCCDYIFVKYSIFAYCIKIKSRNNFLKFLMKSF